VIEQKFSCANGSFLWLVAGLARALAVHLIEQAIEQQGGVLVTIAQRRQRDHGDRQAVEEILPETPIRDLLDQAAVGGGEEADIDTDRRGGADPGDLAFLERAEETDLGRLGQLADLIEEQGDGIGRLEDALARVGRAGEGAHLMAEQLRFDRLGGNRAAVDGDHGAVMARAGLVDRPRQQLLTGAGLALDTGATNSISVSDR